MRARKTPIPSAAGLTEVLRESIRRGEWSAGQIIPSERDLCEESGLSRMTVRRSIQKLIDEGILYRVPGSGTFVGQRNERKLQHATLGLVVPSFANPFYAEVADRIALEARKKGYHLMLGRTEPDWGNETAVLQQCAENPAVKGILIAPRSVDQPTEIYAQFTQRGLPFIFLVRKPEDLEADLVMTDHVRGAREAVRHLIQFGHRQIAYIGPSKSLPNRHLPGYRQALEEAGIPESEDLILSLDGSAEEAGREGVSILLERKVPFTAIFGRNDSTAISVIRTLREKGVRVPDDVSVAGFDNTEAGAHIEPPLTTVDHTLSEMGRQAMSLLLDRVEGRYDGPARQVVISPKLVIRQSSAQPRSTP